MRLLIAGGRKLAAKSEFAGLILPDSGALEIA